MSKLLSAYNSVPRSRIRKFVLLMIWEFVLSMIREFLLQIIHKFVLLIIREFVLPMIRESVLPVIEEFAQTLILECLLPIIHKFVPTMIREFFLPKERLSPYACLIFFTKYSVCTELIFSEEWKEHRLKKIIIIYVPCLFSTIIVLHNILTLLALRNVWIFASLLVQLCHPFKQRHWVSCSMFRSNPPSLNTSSVCSFFQAVLSHNVNLLFLILSMSVFFVPTFPIFECYRNWKKIKRDPVVYCLTGAERRQYKSDNYIEIEFIFHGRKQCRIIIDNCGRPLS